MSRCDSSSCTLAQEEEQYLQNAAPQLTEYVLLCLLFITGLSANLSVCGGGSTLRQDDFMLNYSFSMLPLTLDRDLFPLEALGWRNT